MPSEKFQTFVGKTVHDRDSKFHVRMMGIRVLSVARACQRYQIIGVEVKRETFGLTCIHDPEEGLVARLLLHNGESVSQVLRLQFLPILEFQKPAARMPRTENENIRICI